MGVLNVTPDSFSDGGSFLQTPSAIARALEMLDEGADIIDIGGESTRPSTFHDHSPLSVDEEKHRILPVITGVLAERPEAVISVDTYKPDVAEAALDIGAKLINDISGLTSGPEMAEVAAARNVPYILMHIPGRPRALPERTAYTDVIADIIAFLSRQADIAANAGLARNMIIVDPGIGFGKTTPENFEIIRRLSELRAVGFPVLVGPSRKNFIGKALGGLPPSERLEGTAAAVALCVAEGADIIRVHDVREMARVIKVADAVVRGTADAAG
jgi:dihydropteroate synthase